MAETVKAYDVAGMFLRALGAKDTPAMRRAVAVWLRWESGGTIRGNNPWNLHSGDACPASKGFCPGNGNLPGQIGNRYAGPGDRNVAVFRTLNDGTKASANNLIRLAPSYGYGKVISEARAGDALGFLSALQQSSWSAGHYSYSKLVNAFKSSFNYNTTMTVVQYGGGSTGRVGGGSWDDKTVRLPFGIIFDKMVQAGTLNKDSTFSSTKLGKTWAVIISDTPEWLKLIFPSYPKDKPTDDAWENKLITELQDQTKKYDGKKVSELPDFITVNLSTGTGSATDTESMGSDPLSAFGDIAGGILDAQNWLYAIAIVGGVGMAWYGFARLTGTLPSVPAVRVGV